MSVARWALDAVAGFTPIIARARLLGRSFWVMRYTDGTVINETQMDWLDLPRPRRQAVRLVCPNGQVAQMGDPTGGDMSGRLFQFKCAVATAGLGRGTQAHVIGVLRDDSGACQCAAWNYVTGTLESFEDNILQMRYQQVGQLNRDYLGLLS